MAMSPGQKMLRARVIPPMTDFSKDHYHPRIVAVVVGSFAMAVGLVLRVSGVLLDVEHALLARYQEAGFPIEANGQPWWAILLLLGLTYGLSYLLLEVPGLPRRLLLSVSFMVLVAAASPVAALWGVFWSPVVAILSAAWSAFCAILWARHHPMPCEIVGLPGEGKVIPISGERDRRTG